jgi:predicted metal-dependent enzyme (double-stranded beta helix superfamily)
VCAVIGQLRGDEINRIYETDGDGSLRLMRELTVHAGETIVLERDVIHNIENAGDEQGHALHLYAGDFRAISDRRSLWSWSDHAKKPFSFPELLKESATAMHASGNETGLAALVEAMPAARGFVDALSK